MDIDEKYLKNLLPKRPEDSHKGTFGHVLNVAGSGFYTGAAYFSSVAPLKVGCGKVTLASTGAVLQSVSTLSPDVILMPLSKIKKEAINNFQSVSIGCGLSTDKNSVKLFKQVIEFLSKSEIPLVIDADGLNILSELKSDLPMNTILTPHPKEMSRLMGVEVEDILSQPEFWVKKCCEKYDCAIVLKLHKTIVADNKGHFYINNTGNSALSHAGSGDVLCGMISGLLASGSHSAEETIKYRFREVEPELNCFEASVLGVYLHGLTAEIASKELTEYSTLSSDLLKYIHEAIKTLI